MSSPSVDSNERAEEAEPLTVAELDRMLRGAVESASLGVWVQGEVSGLKIAASGHAYFTLKDEREDAVIEAVAYRESAVRARGLLASGARVVVRGKATVWAPRGRLQLVVESVRPAGRGALLEALEKLKKRLAEEGLFAAERKRPVPSDAKRIGVVTSASGAVIHDIVTVAFRRGAARILLSPALVQGEGAPESIVAALDRIEQAPRLDVIIIGRGGGALEDLMAFNDERVVRRVAACRTPTVSAVGHEVDVSLVDLVADARAATPSQAAEMVVADAGAQREALAHLRSRVARAMRMRVVQDRSTVERLRNRLVDPRVLIAERQQRLDDLGARLRTSSLSAVARRRTMLFQLQKRLVARHPKVVLEQTRGRLGTMHAGLVSAVRGRLCAERSRLSDYRAKLEALSPVAVLSRGYAIATGPDGSALRDARQVMAGDRVTLRLRKGRLLTDVCAIEPDLPPSGTEGKDE